MAASLAMLMTASYPVSRAASLEKYSWQEVDGYFLGGGDGFFPGETLQSAVLVLTCSILTRVSY